MKGKGGGGGIGLLGGGGARGFRGRSLTGMGVDDTWEKRCVSEGWGFDFRGAYWSLLRRVEHTRNCILDLNWKLLSS